MSFELHNAAAKGDLELVRSLIKNGANVNVVDSDERTPLHWAYEKGHADIAKLLIIFMLLKNKNEKKLNYIEAEPMLSNFWDSQLMKINSLPHEFKGSNVAETILSKLCQPDNLHSFDETWRARSAVEEPAIGVR
ncbi:MAG: hypothetical protein RJA83_1438 [Pseudomonadota bacterium]|jgi:hypothetical protein